MVVMIRSWRGDSRATSRRNPEMLAKCVPIALDNALADYGGNVNKTELIDAISGDTGLTRKQAESAVDALVYEVTAGVFAGNPVRITGFGTFKLRERAA